MEKVVKQFRTFRESDQADKRYYLSLTPAERLGILLDLISTYQDAQDEASRGFERVYRIIKLDRR